MLLEAFANLKKEKEAIMALTDLQRKEKQEVEEELQSTEALLSSERIRVNELEAKLQLKTVSAECQIQEVESFSHETLAGALEKNAMLSEKLADTEFLITEEKREKEYLLQRTATLARRDQLQKASIMTLTQEIETLTAKVNDFGDQFSLLATRSIELVGKSSPQKEVEKREDPESADWLEEKKNMAERILTLETSLYKMKEAETIMKDQFVNTLAAHKDDWTKEKQELNDQIQGLITEKEGIEVQVSEIADLLEKDHIQRTGMPFCEDPENDVLEPPGTKQMMRYNQ